MFQILSNSSLYANLSAVLVKYGPKMLSKLHHISEGHIVKLYLYFRLKLVAIRLSKCHSI